MFHVRQKIGGNEVLIMNLFVTKNFIAHSGQPEKFKIECDALTNEDIETLATLINDKFVARNITFSEVFGIPSGGVRLAIAFGKYLDKTSNTTLVLDDVVTTGNSIREAVKFLLDKEKTRNILTCVIFDRSYGSFWGDSIFRM